MLEKVIANHIAVGHDVDQTIMRLTQQMCRLQIIEPLSLALSAGGVSIDKEVWTADALDKLWLAHDRASPHSEEGPIVVAVVNGVTLLIDGHNRPGKRRRRNDRRPMEVLVIKA